MPPAPLKIDFLIPDADKSVLDGWHEAELANVARLRLVGKDWHDISTYFPLQTPERCEKVHQVYVHWLHRKTLSLQTGVIRDVPPPAELLETIGEDLLAPAVPWTVGEVQTITDQAWNWAEECDQPWQSTFEKFWEMVLDALPGRKRSECCAELRKIIQRIPVDQKPGLQIVVDKLEKLLLKDVRSTLLPQVTVTAPPRILQDGTQRNMMRGPSQNTQLRPPQTHQQAPLQNRQVVSSQIRQAVPSQIGQGAPQHHRQEGSQSRRSQRITQQGPALTSQEGPHLKKSQRIRDAGPEIEQEPMI